MRISFRQGIVQAPNAFLQANGATVNLSIASPALVLAAVADGTANYLITERSTVTSAWTGPFVSGTDYWLYWDINPISGVRTFGHTLLEPAEGNSAPLSPANDQHWFDTTQTKMKVWNSVAGRWVNKIRVFAGKYQSGTTFVSMSINAPSYVGTQIGVLENVPVDAGALVFDLNGDPMKRSNGTFFTTEDVVTASLASASAIKVGAVIIEAVATTNIPAYSIVTFSGFHQVALATNIMMTEGAFGMIETDAVIGDVVHVVLQGVVTNPAWDWTAQGVNNALYVSSTGSLTTTPPPNPVVVGTVVDVNSILLRPSLQTITVDGGTLGPATTTTLGTVRLSTAGTSPLSPVVVEDSDPRLSNKVLRAGDTMTGLLILSGDPVANLGAATKQYVDARTLNDLSDVISTGPTAGQMLQFNGTNWVPVNPEPAVFTYTANQNMLGTHRGAIVRMDSGTATTYTIRTNANVPMPIGATIVVSQQGTGTVTIGSEGGVTVVSPETLDIRKQYGKVTLTQTSANYWEVEGNLTAL